MSQPFPDPTVLMSLVTDYWKSATLMAANQLRLFGLLAYKPQSAAEIAGRLNAPVRSITMLMDACVGLELILKTEEDGEAIYRNTPASEAFLVPGRPGYLGSAIRWAADQYTVWGQLAPAVIADAPVVSPADHLGQDPALTRTFVFGMHARAAGVARGVVPFLDLSGTKSLLDVGGGPGTYAMLLGQKYPELQVTVLDLPPVLAVAKELLLEAHQEERVGLLPGDATTDDYGVEEYDAVLFSGVLHQMSPAVIAGMLERAFRTLKPGGKVLICDMMLEPDKTQPVFSALFSLQMLLTSQEGAVFSAQEGREWLAQAGFVDVQEKRLPPPLPYTLLTGVKREA